ncbi:hypothetical protein BHAOGJBA_6365 [Methylobacterium hispanicum]|uniref:Uncharacterized protein n=1 Tax=Methylobacterium hispanicum TaxID=270350 RepID=A0AAV5A1M2_9HYPH|nr:hypothetical protein BHAOGJBA_6365 [Methylobacterium hispanicum]
MSTSTKRSGSRTSMPKAAPVTTRPAASVTRTWLVAAGAAALGVPEIRPVSGSRTSPAGRAEPSRLKA